MRRKRINPSAAVPRIYLWKELIHFWGNTGLNGPQDYAQRSPTSVSHLFALICLR